MTLEDEVLDSLQDLKYPDFETIENNVSLLTDLQTFSSIISWISNQLRAIDGIESSVNPIKDESEFVSFKIELNSLLRETDCPLIDSSFTDPFNRLAILNSLCGQLLSSRMNDVNQEMTISMTESQTARDLKTILVTLGMGKPPNDINCKTLFKKIRDKLMERLVQQNQTIEDSLLLPEGLTLSPDQWKSLESVNEELKKDYTIRREMLLRRCDCTVSSFSWKSDNSNHNSKATEEQIREMYSNERNYLSIEPNVCLATALAARQSDLDDLINGVISKCPTNCVIKIPEMKGMANKGLQQEKQMAELHKYRIGWVPDRGGRPNEQPKPSKESFSQQQFQRDNPQRGRGRGGYAGAGGSRGGSAPNISQNTGRIQGMGWTNNTGDRYKSGSGYDNQKRRYEQNHDNYRSGQYQRMDTNNQYNSGYQYQPQPQQQRQPQQYRSSNNPNQAYNDQECDKQFNNNNNYYSEQTYYASNRQQQSGGYRGRGGSGRRY